MNEPSRPVLDTNVVLYLLSDDANKADIAESLLRSGGVVSVQVLNEAASVCIRRLKLPWAEVLAAVRAFCEVLPLDLATRERALAIAERYRLSLYDALILAAAQGGGADVLYSEDMQDGFSIDGLVVRNPFLKA